MEVKRYRGTRLLILACTAILLMGIAGAALADEAEYSIDWWTVDGGGGTMEGDTYRLSGGFWQEIVELVEDFFHIFLPLIER
jgi:hypothetical protein